MKFKFNIVSCILSLSASFLACADNTHISFFCEKDKQANYIIKWEIFPEKENSKVEIFSSRNDSVFSKNPVKVLSVSDYVAVVSPEANTFREYFRLKAGNTFSGIITNRFFNTQNIQNLRDMGGYFSKSEKQIKWGKLYRSGQLSNLDAKDIEVLDSLHIKTVVDFRDAEQSRLRPDNYPKANVIELPIDVTCFNTDVRDRVLEGSFLKGDTIIYTQDSYREIIENYPDQYARFFDILCDEDNYPILFHCGWGKDRTGLAAYFILKALNIPAENIEQDYLYSNEGINKDKVLQNAENMPESVQEAITMLYLSDASYLRYAVSCMKKKSGSVEEYMHKELKLTPAKLAKLRQILCYDN
ncbi:MAG: tyrosine-protein phosphatase [Dysgonomonas sp.]